jgi:hypothetical protein
MLTLLLLGWLKVPKNRNRLLSKKKEHKRKSQKFAINFLIIHADKECTNFFSASSFRFFPAIKSFYSTFVLYKF